MTACANFLLLLVSSKKKYCPICQNQKILFAPSGSKESFSFLEVCHCIDEKCLCDKKPPYIYFDEEQQKTIECSCASTRRRLTYMHKLFLNSGIPKKYRYRRLNEFVVHGSTDSDKKEMLLMKTHAQNLAKNARLSKRGICYLGASGSGKTFIASLILNEIIYQHAIPVKFLKITRDFFNQIRATYSAESNNYGKGEDIFKKIASIPILLLDDFGVQADSPWEQRMLYDLIDMRYENEQMTLITTNLDFNRIKPLFDGRIYSRLKEMTDFQFLTAPDYREKFMQVYYPREENKLNLPAQ